MGPIKIALTPGEPAGIGPDLILQLAQHPLPCEVVVFASPDLLMERATLLAKNNPEKSVPISLIPYSANAPATLSGNGKLTIYPIQLKAPVTPSVLALDNSPYVLECIEQAAQSVEQGECSALVTGPVHKEIINQYASHFKGHTEYLARLFNLTPQDVLMGFISESMILGLVTTHIPLKEVPQTITKELLTKKIEILHEGLKNQFGYASPLIGILALNPHAGEKGILGIEESTVIEPTLRSLVQKQQYKLTGPLSPDTAFCADTRKQFHALLAMYHDQGLAPFKALTEHHAVNMTFGLPIIRTSVDHGTALSLAGTNKGNPQSLLSALHLAVKLARNKAPA